MIIVKKTEKTEKTEIVSPLERIGRLGLKTVKFDIGSGGTPFFKGCEYAAVLSGLSRLEMAWVMYAYVNTSSESELDYIVAALLPKVVCDYNCGDIVANKLIRLVCREFIQGKTLSGRLRAIVLGVPTASYIRYREKYENAILFVNSVLMEIEKVTSKKIESNS